MSARAADIGMLTGLRDLLLGWLIYVLNASVLAAGDLSPLPHVASIGLLKRLTL